MDWGLSQALLCRALRARCGVLITFGLRWDAFESTVSDSTKSPAGSITFLSAKLPAEIDRWPRNGSTYGSNYVPQRSRLLESTAIFTIKPPV